jgi:polyphosphate kinase 2 (PPK2 family)
LPPRLAGRDLWQRRFDAICSFERHLAGSGTLVLKFFLNVSRKEQRQRFLDRIDQPDKRWKFSMNDVTERKLWPKYMAAYEDMIRATSRLEAPWYVVPADNKWFTRLVVAAALVEALDRLKLEYPKVTGKALRELKKAGRALQSERGGR